MILVGKIIALLLFLLVVPFLVGTLITRFLNTDKDRLLLNWVAGFVGLLALAQVLIVPATFLNVKFHVIVILFYGTAVFGALLALIL